MTNKKTITLSDLKEKLKEIFARSEESLKHYQNVGLAEDEGVFVRLNEDDAFYNHIEMFISKEVNYINPQGRLGVGLRIRELAVTYTKTSEKLGIALANHFIDGLALEDVEFNYIGAIMASKSSKTPGISLWIITSKCIVVKLLRCTTNNVDVLVIRYSVPNTESSVSHITLEDCKFFKDFHITVGSETDVKMSPKIRAEEKSGFPGEVIHVPFALVLDKNVFQRFLVKLSQSTGIEYQYEYNAKLINGNNIQEIDILDKYPNIIKWGTREEIGEKIAKKYKSTPKSKYNDNIEVRISALKRAEGKVETNKEFLVRFRKLADEKGDRLQASIINYHIAACDEQLIDLETDRRFSQDKLIMKFGRLLSRHGTSWLRPLAWIIGSNFIAANIIFLILILCVCKYSVNYLDVLYIFKELGSPLSTPLGIVKGIDTSFNYRELGGVYLWIAAAVLLSKAFYAVCIYEFVRAARRFTLK